LLKDSQKKVQTDSLFRVPKKCVFPIGKTKKNHRLSTSGDDPIPPALNTPRNHQKPSGLDLLGDFHILLKIFGRNPGFFNAGCPLFFHHHPVEGEGGSK